MKRKICIVSGSRAEFGLLSGLAKSIVADSQLELQLLVTGMHLSPEFGLTWKAIEDDGFRIDRKIEMLLSSDSAVGISKSMALAQIGFAEAFEDLRPDMVVLLGDRFETLSAASAALIARLPIAHLHGGEATEGAYDDAIRHAITKMSHLHFTSTEAYRRRVIQMGEKPEHVYNVGAIGLDAIFKLDLLSVKKLTKELNFSWKKRNLLVTFHPSTLEKESPGLQFQELLNALDKLNDSFVIFTRANADSGGRIINQMIDNYTSSRPDNTIAFSSLGQLRYLSLLKHVDMVVGNSSSGIIEAPSFRTPTINIGDRQKGRIQTVSVINCDPKCISIRNALVKAEAASFRRRLFSMTNPYGDGKTIPRILSLLKAINLENLPRKAFHDWD